MVTLPPCKQGLSLLGLGEKPLISRYRFNPFKLLGNKHRFVSPVNLETLIFYAAFVESFDGRAVPSNSGSDPIRNVFGDTSGMGATPKQINVVVGGLRINICLNKTVNQIEGDIQNIE